MQLQRAISYRQIFLLILTIWSAHLCTRLLFDVLLPAPVEFRTVYLEKDPKKDLFIGSALGDLGRKGWQIVGVEPNPDNSQEMIVFLQRRTLPTWKRE